MRIADLRDCPASGLFYGGRAGQKEGILVDGAPWIAKYPRTTRDLQGKHLPPYTSSPVSEYLGAHIYASLGIPVHETMLGYRNGKVVSASMKESSTNSSCINDMAILAARNSRFNVDDTGSDKQSGTITYIFVPQ